MKRTPQNEAVVKAVSGAHSAVVALQLLCEDREILPDNVFQDVMKEIQTNLQQCDLQLLSAHIAEVLKGHPGSDGAEIFTDASGRVPPLTGVANVEP